MNIFGQMPFFGFPPPLPQQNFPPPPVFHPGPQMQMPFIQHAPQMAFAQPQMPVAQAIHQLQPQAFQHPAQTIPVTINLVLHLCNCLPRAGGQGQQVGQPTAPPVPPQAQNNQNQNAAAQNLGNVAPQANPQPVQNPPNVNVDGRGVPNVRPHPIPQPEIPPPPANPPRQDNLPPM
jgi:hypothetical protein